VLLQQGVKLPLFAALAIVPALGCVAPRELHDVTYDPRHGDAGRLDLYLPELDDHAHATVLFIHGGSWTTGDKSIFAAAGRRLASSGFAVASTNYRLLPTGVFPDDAEDCMCAYAYLRAHAADYAIDPERIVVMGYSAGGHLAGLVGLAADDPALASDCDAAGGQPVPRPAAVISASGPQDLRVLWGQFGMGSTLERMFGGTPDAQPAAYALGSPITHVAPGAPPFLIIQDAIDFGGMVAMSEALKAAGDQETLLHISGSAHVLEQWDEPGEYEAGVSSDAPEAWIATEDFLFDTVGAP